MRIRLPSFRFQIILLVSLITLIASLLMRSFFINNLSEYQDQITNLSTKEKARDLYKNYSHTLDSTNVEGFSREIEGILRDLQKIEIAGDFYGRDIERYSIGIVILMVIFTGGIFLLLFMMITRPLARLTAATEQLKRGDFEIHVKESTFSPLNNLILAFNNMVAELNQSRERLIEAERQTIWREMARAMAHEIKNPLTPIRLATQRLEMKYHEKAEDLPKVLEKTMGVINEEVDNLQALVNSFSGFAKMPEAKLENYNLNKQLQDISDQYSDDAKVEIHLDDRLENITADIMQMKQVLVNLIQNAIQACPDEPHIIIETKVVDQSCRISITDHGQGIEAEYLTKIFEPYYTTKKKGTGLGLAIVRRIIRQHGGDIQVFSEVGEGSTFQISLPCNREIKSTKENE
ncbi:MAG: GHKL domain-containing protein [Candidatus Marinimicrobia bacterium]|nr:GHKL domain-containing protein [Candidatus Neomarinimicrobiota bacterium]